MSTPRYVWYLDNRGSRANGVREFITHEEMEGFNILKLLVRDLTNQRHSNKRQNEIDVYLCKMETWPEEQARWAYLKEKVLPVMLMYWNKYRNQGDTIKKCNQAIQ